MAELIDKHHGTFYSLKTHESVLMSQPCFSKIVKHTFFEHKSSPTNVFGYLLYTKIGITSFSCKTTV